MWVGEVAVLVLWVRVLWVLVLVLRLLRQPSAAGCLQPVLLGMHCACVCPLCGAVLPPCEGRGTCVLQRLAGTGPRLALGLLKGEPRVLVLLLVLLLLGLQLVLLMLL